ncbi:MAG: hypothetical protein V3U60_16010 [Gammaproteobacteria bacterium]
MFGFGKRTTVAAESSNGTEQDMRLLLEELTDTATQIMLAQDSQGWQKLGASDQPISDEVRRKMVKLARVYSVRDPLCKNIVRTYTNFAVGTGFSVRAEDGEAKQVLDAFTGDRLNKRMFSTQGQRRSSNKLLSDGEVFFALFPSDRGIGLRYIDPLEISAVITHPEDAMTPIWYERSTQTGTGQPKVEYYRDWENEDNISEGYKGGSLVMIHDEQKRDALVCHVKLEDEYLRGNSILTPVLEWCRGHAQFMESRLAVQQAIAQFIRKLRTKGNAAQMTALKNVLHTTITSNTGETNPPKVPGSTFMENEGAELKPVAQDTGAAGARTDGGMILQVIGAGAGIFPHYFGAGEAFRLATATAMEPPMQKTFEAYNELWKDTYREIFDFVLEGESVSDAKYTIDSPDIFPQDKHKAIDSATKAVKEFPQLAFSDDVLKRLLTNMGIDDPNAALAAINAPVNQEETAKSMLWSMIKKHVSD